MKDLIWCWTCWDETCMCVCEHHEWFDLVLNLLRCNMYVCVWAPWMIWCSTCWTCWDEMCVCVCESTMNDLVLNLLRWNLCVCVCESTMNNLVLNLLNLLRWNVYVCVCERHEWFGAQPVEMKLVCVCESTMNDLVLNLLNRLRWNLAWRYSWMGLLGSREQHYVVATVKRLGFILSWSAWQVFIYKCFDTVYFTHEDRVPLSVSPNRLKFSSSALLRPWGLGEQTHFMGKSQD